MHGLDDVDGEQNGMVNLMHACRDNEGGRFIDYRTALGARRGGIERAFPTFKNSLYSGIKAEPYCRSLLPSSYAFPCSHIYVYLLPSPKLLHSSFTAQSPPQAPS